MVKKTGVRMIKGKATMVAVKEEPIWMRVAKILRDTYPKVLTASDCGAAVQQERVIQACAFELCPHEAHYFLCICREKAVQYQEKLDALNGKFSGWRIDRK
jgi:hypothetical protein